MKTCTGCKVEQPLAEFRKGKGYRDGVRSECKTCELARERARRARHRQAGTARARDYKAEYSRDKSLGRLTDRAAYHKQWRDNRTVVVTDGKKTCRECGEEKPHSEFYVDRQTRDGLTRSCKSCRVERALVNSRTEKGKMIKANTRYRRRSAGPITRVSLAEWAELLETFNRTCAYCGGAGKLTMDHVDPLTKGGMHQLDNIVPACGACNASKRDRPLLLWLRTRPKTLNRVG